MLKETKIGGLNAIYHTPDKNKALPTEVFFSGLGEAGSNILSLYKFGPAPFLRDGWSPGHNVIVVQPKNGFIPVATMAGIVKDIQAFPELKISDLIGIGYSAGAASLEDYVSKTPGHPFKALVLFSYGPVNADMKNWNNYPPSWGICGDKDGSRIIPLKAMVTGIIKAGKKAKYTEVEGTHTSIQPYFDPNWKHEGMSVYEWPLQFTGGGVIVKPEPEPEVPPKPQPSNRIMLPMKDGVVYVKTWPTAPKPGDTLVIPKGTQQVFLSGFEGSKDNYITIEQEDPAEWGKVANYLFSIENAKYFRIKGVKINGGPDHKGFNLAMGKGTSDYTVEDYSSRYGVNGIKASWNPVAGDPSTYAPNTINNLVFENIHVQDTINEGLYIGNTLAINETTALIPARIKGLVIRNVKTERTGWDGVQVAHAEGITLENIEAIDSGLANNPIQSNGVIIGGYTIVDKIDGIKVSGATGGGLTIFGRGKIHAKNVTIDGAKTGIYTDDYADGLMGLPVQELVFENVTVSKSTQDDIEIRNAKGTAKKATFINVKATTVKDATGGWNTPEPPKPEPPKPEPPKPTKKLVATVKVYDDGSIEKV